MDDEELETYIKPISNDAAFNKGVEYFSEIFLLYGVLLCVSAYEIDKAAKTAAK